MTSPLRKRRPTTAPSTSTTARTAVSLVGLGLLLAAVPASAQATQPEALTATPTWASSSPYSATMDFRQGPSVPSAQARLPEQVLQFGREAPPAASSPATVWVPSQPALISGIQRAAMQRPDGGRRDARGGFEEGQEFPIQLAPPGQDRLFKLQSEHSLKEQMRQEARGRGTTERMVFPDEPVLPREPLAPRDFPPMVEVVEPHYVCYGRLLFEQINSERYDWDLGIIDPLLQAGKFYADVAMLPYHLATRPCECYECSAGYCLPGDPVPLYLYPPEFSVTGAAAEAAAAAGLLWLFP